MASVSKINGRYRAQVRRKGHKAVSKWFDREGPAWTWANDVEAKMDAGTYNPDAAETVGQMIKRYRRMRSETRPIGRRSTEYHQINLLEAVFGTQPAYSITAQQVVDWARKRSKVVKPSTIKSDVSKLITMFRYTSDKVPEGLTQAMPRLAHLRLIGESERRDRRPKGGEMEKIISWVQRNKGQKYADAIRFSVITAMRRGEVVELRRADVDQELRLIRVLRKHPRKGKVAEMVPLIGESMEILLAQPVDEDRDPERFFPFPAAALSKHFNAACVAEKIDDLRLHDLRHEGISKLFEQGLQIQHVVLVSGHKDWRQLKRYTNLKPESVHDLIPSPGTGTHRSKKPDPGNHTTDDDHPGKS